ncbi:hypothetical protein STEG23_024578 [Scotinomys teguina]
MEVVAAAPRCQLLLILLMSAVMLLPGTNGSLLLVQRTVTRTIMLQETIGKVEGQLGCFQVVAITNNAAVNIVEQDNDSGVSNRSGPEMLIKMMDTRLLLSGYFITVGKGTITRCDPMNEACKMYTFKNIVLTDLDLTV